MNNNILNTEIQDKQDTENLQSMRSIMNSYNHANEAILQDSDQMNSPQINALNPKVSVSSLVLDKKSSSSNSQQQQFRPIIFQTNKPILNTKDESPVFMESSELDIQGFSNTVWRQRALEILMLTLRFISFITKSNFATSFKLINKHVFDIIGDVSSDFGYYLMNNYFKYEKPNTVEKISYFLNQSIMVPIRKAKLLRTYLGNERFILRPESLASIWWNIYILTILNINVLYVSAKMSFKFDGKADFEDSFYQARQIMFDVLPSYSFIMEIILKFNTCYYYKGAVIENRLLIAKNYMRQSFFFDIVVVIPYFISLRFQLEYLDLVIILKVFQITKFSRTLFDRLELTAIQIVICDVVKLIYTILAAAHFSACLWFLIGSTGDPNETSWITAQNIQDEDWFSQYLHSFYWSIITMTTIGYGDIIPQNLRERTFTIAMALSAVGVFGYSIGNINSIYAQWSSRSYQIRMDTNNLKKFIRLKGINKHLAEKIRKYFEYVWSDQMEDNDKEVYKFSELIPKELAEEMKIDTNMKLIQKIEFLSNNFSEQFLIALSKNISEEKFVPEQTIYEQNDSSDCFYILSNGSISFYVTMNNKEKNIKTLETITKEGISFGTLEFFQQQPYTTSCKSNQFSYILKIERTQFIELLKQHQNDYYKYCELIQQISFMNKQELINVTCRACNKVTHTIKNCPMVCGSLNRAKVLLNHRRSIPDDRNWKFKRSSERRIHSKADQNDIRNSIYLYICKTNMFPEELKKVNGGINQSGGLGEDDQIVEQTPQNSDELGSLLITTPLRNRNPTKLQRKLTFKECNDVLNDEDIRDRILGIISTIQKAERSSKYMSRFGLGQHPAIQISEPQIAAIGNKSDSERKRSSFQGTDPSKHAQTPQIKINDLQGEAVINKEEEEKNLFFMGQYKDLFEEFDKVKIFDYYLNYSIKFKKTRQKIALI